MVLDASAAVAWLFGACGAAPVASRIGRSEETVHVPHLFDLEIVNALRRAGRAGRVSSDRALGVLADLSALRAMRYPHGPFVPRIWELRENLSAYDAAYVALAEALDAPLLTLDGRLARAPGVRARVELVR